MMGTKRSAADEHDSGDSTVEPVPAFDTVRKGYRPEQVDTAVRELQWRLEMAERSQQEAEERVAALTASLEAARATTPDTFGMRAEKILRMAEHDAAQRRERAVYDADRIIDAAHDEAERLIAAARAEGERARTDAVAAVAQVHADAAAARRETDLCADTAAAMHEHVVGLRGAVRGELARLHAAMGAELRILDEMVATPPAPAPAATTTPAPEPATGRDPATRPSPAPTAPVAVTPRTTATTEDIPAAGTAPSATPTVALPEQRPQPSRETTADAPATTTGARTEPAGA
ncbi:DivIVA domain-containing protein [Pseudonocardia sediminis]|uniref:DivIVA domain-containing protein n=1 Tax=Pseudonocardia sediminis TaxID=1397368 RepID=UPI00102A098D|nr:hypothetical protein [Pseudonocardia sediminis]